MKHRQVVLRAHYLGLLRKVATWTGLISILAMNFVAGTVSAAGAQITSRSVTMGSSTLSASTTYAFSFKLATASAIKAVMLQVCTSPLETTTCTVATGASFSGASLSAQGGQFSGWTVGAGTPPAPTANTFYLFSATGFTGVTATTQTLTLSGVTNPSTANTQFYTRITTYSNYNGSGGTGEVDFGAEALSTGSPVTVAANVQESLTFCVYTSTCGGGVTGNFNIGSGADNTLSTSAMSGNVSKMDASTNASAGYTITYITGNTGGTAYNCTGVTGAASGSFGSATDCIPDAGSSAVSPPSAGTGMFGINLATNTTALTPSGALGAAPTGSGTGTASAPYATADHIAFQAGATPRTVASAAGPTVANTFTVTYAAQAGSINKPGAYLTTFTYVCTGTF
jgi:hypothetical protein